MNESLVLKLARNGTLAAAPIYLTLMSIRHCAKYSLHALSLNLHHNPISPVLQMKEQRHRGVR